MALQSGITANTEKRLVLDSGALYRNYGETDEQLIGATRGGATFTVEREDREIEVDGTRGPVIGLKRTVRHTAMLEMTLIEVSEQTFLDLTRGTSVSDGTHLEISPDNSIVSGDYYTNVALVAEINNESDPIIIKLLNALVAQEWDISTEDQDEGEISVTFEAHYSVSAINDPPYRILLPVSAS